MAERKIVINTNTLKSDISNIEESLKKISEKLQTINQNMKDLNVNWTGYANAALMEQYMKDVEMMQEILKKLADYTEDLQEAEKEYNRCEKLVGDIVTMMLV